MGKLSTLIRPCIIFGPNKKGEYIYIFKTLFTGSLYIAFNELPSFIKPPKGEEWRMSGTMPLKSFHIYDANDGSELMYMTKRLLHIMPHYDFYKGDEKIGRLRKHMDFIHDYYTLDTPEGKIKLRSVSATFGDNFQVWRNGEIIGTIAEKLNMTLENMVFDNFVIYTRNTHDNLMMTALAVMVARGQARRRNLNALADD